MPTLAAALGVKGHRPGVGTRDDKDLLYVFGSVKSLDGRLRTATVESRQRDNRRARKHGGPSKARRIQVAFARHLAHVAAAHPDQRAVMLIDNGPRHRACRPVMAADVGVRPGRPPPGRPPRQRRRWRSTASRRFGSPGESPASSHSPRAIPYERTHLRESSATPVGSDRLIHGSAA